jgi:phospholipase/carboxylesterase
VIYAERPAEGTAAGALVLVHGRGSDEHDLVGLLDALDPERRLHGYCPRGPLSLPPGGAHWYAVHRVGFPDTATFAEGYTALSEFVDSLPYEQIVLGGFSQGAVMSFAVGLGEDRPRPTALACFSGFVPHVEGWRLDGSRPFPPIAIGHGTYDPVIPIEFAQRSLADLRAAGAEPLYRESPMQHSIDPAFVAELRPWIRQALGATKSSEG